MKADISWAGLSYDAVSRAILWWFETFGLWAHESKILTIWVKAIGRVGAILLLYSSSLDEILMFDFSNESYCAAILSCDSLLNVVQFR